MDFTQCLHKTVSGVLLVHVTHFNSRWFLVAGSSPGDEEWTTSLKICLVKRLKMFASIISRPGGFSSVVMEIIVAFLSFLIESKVILGYCYWNDH